jgi:hypothetical protein
VYLLATSAVCQAGVVATRVHPTVSDSVRLLPQMKTFAGKSPALPDPGWVLALL